MATLMQDTDFVVANEAAREIAEAAIVAYWMGRKGHPHDVDHHRRHMRDRLDRLCEVMGLRVVDATDTPQHRMNVAAMLQSASNMIPEE